MTEPEFPDTPDFDLPGRPPDDLNGDLPDAAPVTIPDGARVWLVPTPVGNLGDITLRALEVLRAADAVACEDTRRTGALLTHLGIKKPLVRLDAHTMGRAPQVLERYARLERWWGDSSMEKLSLRLEVACLLHHTRVDTRWGYDRVFDQGGVLVLVEEVSYEYEEHPTQRDKVVLATWFPA